MKFVYFIMGGENPNSGVSQKIFAQLSALTNLGVDAKIILIKSNDFQYPSYPFLKIFQIKVFSPYNFIGRVKRLFEIRSKFSETIKSLDSSDVMYFRYSVTSPMYYPINYLKNFRKCKFVTEHQTIETKEFKLNHLYRLLLREILFGKIIRRQSDAIVGVTNEITDYQLAFSGDLNKPHITIGNGVCVEACAQRHPPAFDGNKLDLLFVANVSVWHGLDRLVRGLANYNGKVHITLNIAGDGAELPIIQRMTNDLGISDQVIFHGFKIAEELDELFNTCHIAVGSLGIHRKGLGQTSELKAREYCARGMPFIIACGDPDFPENFPYIQKIPADETPVDLERIVNFARMVFEDPAHSKKMREYAVEYLDWSVKMKNLKDFLETIV